MNALMARLGKLVVGYGAVQWAGPFISLIFTPIITRALTPQDYGIADYLATIASMLSTLALFALPHALTTHFNDRPNDTRWQHTTTASAVSIVTVFGLVIGFVLVLTAPAITSFIAILGPYTPLVILTGISLPFAVVASMLTSAAQTALRARWGMLISSVTIVATVVYNLLFIVVLRLGVTGMILAQALLGVTLFIVAIWVVRPIVGRPDRATLQLLLRSGLILLPTMMAGWALSMSDRLFLGRYVTGTELGYYAIANKMANLVHVAMAPVYMAWTPLALAMQHEPDAKRRYISVSRYLVAGVMCIGLGVGLFATEILIILTRPAYLPAAPYVGFLTYVPILSGFGVVLSTGAMMGKQLLSMSGSVAIGAVINLGLNFLLIPRFGVWGATASTVISYAAIQIILYLWVQRQYPIDYPTGRMVSALALTLVILIIGLDVPPLYFPLRIALKLALYLLFPAGLLVLRLIEWREVTQAMQLVKAKALTYLPVKA